MKAQGIEVEFNRSALTQRCACRVPERMRWYQNGSQFQCVGCSARCGKGFCGEIDRTLFPKQEQQAEMFR